MGQYRNILHKAIYVPFHKRKQILGFVIPVGDYLQHKRKIKMSQIVVFWAETTKLKCHKIQKLLKVNREIEIPRKFMQQKLFITLKVSPENTFYITLHAYYGYIFLKCIRLYFLERHIKEIK